MLGFLKVVHIFTTNKLQWYIMRKCLLLFIALFPCLNLYSQNLSLLFKNDLPKDINKYFTDESVNDILIRDAELNPELLYWHINFLKELVENKNTDNDKNGFNYFKKLTNQNLHKRNNFLEEIKLKAGQGVSDEYKRKINDVLNEYALIPPQNLKPYKNIPDYDTNKVYFLSAKYLNGNSGLSYNKEEDYRAIVKEIELKRVADLKQKISNMKNQQGNITIDYLECIINNWRLVKDNPEIMADLSSAIEQYIDQKYSIRKLKKMDITAGYSFTFHQEWFSYDILYPHMGITDHRSETKNYQTFVLQAEYKFLLKELISFLSYINIGINASTASSPIINLDNYFYSQDYNVISETNYSNRYFVANNIKISEQKYYSLYGKISVPVLIITPEIIVNAGVMGRINYYLANLSYNYSYRNTVYSYTLNGGYQYVYLQNVKNAPYEESISRHMFYVSPVVELNFSLLKDILFQFTTSGFNYFSINAGVEF